MFCPGRFEAFKLRDTRYNDFFRYPWSESMYSTLVPCVSLVWLLLCDDLCHSWSSGSYLEFPLRPGIAVVCLQSISVCKLGVMPLYHLNSLHSTEAFTSKLPSVFPCPLSLRLTVLLLALYFE